MPEVSELITQSKLDLARRADDAAVAEAFGGAKPAVSNTSVQSPEDMPVEGVRYVHLEDDCLIFVKRGSFLDGEVFIEVGLATNIAKNQGCSTVYVSTLRDQARRVGVKEGGAVEVVVIRQRRSTSLRRPTNVNVPSAFSWHPLKPGGLRVAARFKEAWFGANIGTPGSML